MRYAILSDVHGNLEALEAALTELASRDVDRYVCLGDVVGYGADPAACLDRLCELDALCVLGNHDAAAVGSINTLQFNTYATSALEWTRDHLREEHRRHLLGLPFVASAASACFTHASFFRPEWFRYLRSIDDVQQCFDQQPSRIAFIGHSHVPIAYVSMDGILSVSFDAEIDLANVDQAILNVGSVGQPRDQDPRASCAVYDSREERYELVRVPYDVAGAAAKIASAGLPGLLGERLKVGV